MSTIAIRKTGIKVKSITTALAVVAAVALPQLFHAVGVLSGTGASLGSAFLPMHIPVLLAGLLAGPIAGVVAGALSPLVSFAVSGMPAVGMLPGMTVELIGYGLAAGLLYRVKMPVIGKLLIAQVAGRLLRAAFILFSVYALGNSSLMVSSIWTGIAASLPGILLQWAFIPLLLHRITYSHNSNAE